MIIRLSFPPIGRNSMTQDTQTHSETTPIAQRIRRRLIEAGRRFHANDCIADVIEPGELDALQAEVAGKLQDVLDALVIDTESDHNTEGTAGRVAKMFIREVFRGRYVPMPPVTEFPNIERLNELMIVGPVTIRSACSHHLCPIIGQLWVGVMPNEHSALIGLSKYARLVEWVMARPQIQEEAIIQLADLLAGQDAPRRAGDHHARRSLLHAVARGQGHGLEDGQQRDARELLERSQSPPRVPRTA
jgi:GTP cyclohydrolase I